MTITIIALGILYAFLKLNVLISRLNPNISVTKVINKFGMYDTLNLNEINFRMAFVIENFDNKETKGDPRYIKYLARVW